MLYRLRTLALFRAESKCRISFLGDLVLGISPKSRQIGSRAHITGQRLRSNPEEHVVNCLAMFVPRSEPGVQVSEDLSQTTAAREGAGANWKGSRYRGEFLEIRCRTRSSNLE